MDSIKTLFKRIRRYLQIKSALKYARHFLVDGIYKVDERTICKIKKNDKKNNSKTFNVHCKNKIIEPVDCLYFIVNKYKFIFVAEKQSFFYIKKRKRYLLFKKRYSCFGNTLLYHHINLEFFDKKKLVVGDTAIGIKYKSHEMFDEVVNIIVGIAQESNSVVRNIKISNKEYSVPFYVQHGDFKDSNIIWDGNNYKLIDLEEIGVYPILFDLFFYTFISKPFSFLDIIFSNRFVELVKNVWKKLDESISFREKYIFVDYTVSIYLSYLLQMYKKEHTKEFFNYYLFWTSSNFLKDKRLTQTKLIIDSELYTDKLYLKKIKRTK